jgi:ATP-dependent DNA ligase
MFWYPEKPNHIFDTSIIPDNYIAQIKKDGWRIIVTNINGKLELFNRHGKLISAAQDKEWMWINKIFPGKFYLDGELIGQRQKNVLTNTIAIWDALYLEDKFLFNLPYIERYNLLLKYADVNNPSMDYNNQKTL